MTGLTRTAAIAAVVVAVGSLLLNLAVFLKLGAFALTSPLELDYGEGIVWEQMRLMLAGRGYAEITGLPAIVFHYPPLYHLVTAAVSLVIADPLAAGRLVSLSSTVAMAVLAGLIVAKTVRPDASRRSSLSCGVVAGLLTLSFGPIQQWAPLMRVDMLATALSLAGLLAAMSALKRNRLIYLAALLFVTATYTKQTEIIAPAASFLALLVVRPRLGWQLLGACLAFGLPALAAMMVITHGQFLEHIFVYNVNRFSIEQFLILEFVMVSENLVYLSLFVIVIFNRTRAMIDRYRSASTRVDLRARLGENPVDCGFLFVVIYALLTALSTATVAKSGANFNYFIDFLVAVAIILGVGLRGTMAAIFGDPTPTTRTFFDNPAFVPMLIALQAILFVAFRPNPYAGFQDQEFVTQSRDLQALIGSQPGPVVSDNMMMLVRAGKPVIIEPAIFAELTSRGIWDDSHFLDLVRSRRFAFFVTAGSRGEPIFDKRYTPALASAIYRDYPVTRRFGGYVAHFPSAVGGGDAHGGPISR